MHQFTRFKTAIGLSIALVISMPIFAADRSIDTLKAKQARLEAELEKIKSDIASLEAEQSGDRTVDAKPTWFVTGFGIDKVNSAGGVEPYFVFFNPNEASAVKYINVRVKLYNAVGDQVTSELGSQGLAGLSFTGPLLNSDGNKRADWGPVWYNSTGRCIRVDSIQVTFVNGKTLGFSGKELRKALNPSLSNDCKMKN